MHSFVDARSWSFCALFIHSLPDTHCLLLLPHGHSHILPPPSVWRCHLLCFLCPSLGQWPLCTQPVCTPHLCSVSPSLVLSQHICSSPGSPLNSSSFFDLVCVIFFGCYASLLLDPHSLTFHLSLPDISFICTVCHAHLLHSAARSHGQKRVLD